MTPELPCTLAAACSTGLHPEDIDTLLGVLDRLLEAGHTAVVIEHELEVIRRADHPIDLGPGPGRHGGRVLYEGPVSGITDTPTAQALARDVSAAATG